MEKVAIIGLVILLLLGFSGCTEVRNQATEDFATQLTDISDYIFISLGNINADIYNFDYDFQWSYMMGLAAITTSQINDMETIENSIKTEIEDIENKYDEYLALKQHADLNQLSVDEKELVDYIEWDYTIYLENKSILNTILEKMAIYRNFVDLIRIYLGFNEEWDTQTTFLDNNIYSGNYNDALANIENLKNITKEMKSNMWERHNLSIFNYSGNLLNSFDSYLESWFLYEEYIHLVMDGKSAQAEVKYDEYYQKFTEAATKATSITATSINDQIDIWYESNIGDYLTLFEEYYTT